LTLCQYAGLQKSAQPFTVLLEPNMGTFLKTSLFVAIMTQVEVFYEIEELTASPGYGSWPWERHLATASQPGIGLRLVVTNIDLATGWVFIL